MSRSGRWSSRRLVEADTSGGNYAIDGGGLTVVSGNYLATILQDPSNATAFTVIPIPSTSPQAHQEVLDNRGRRRIETVEDRPPRVRTNLNIVGTSIVSDDMADGKNDEMAGQLCVSGRAGASEEHEIATLRKSTWVTDDGRDAEVLA